MKYTIYQVDAFSDHLFGGNPAAIVPLERWLEDDLMQKIALENNLSETAFFVSKGYDYHIRWFTPLSEVDLCGHATLACAHVLFEHLNYTQHEIRFESRSGQLSVQRQGDWYTLDFPSDQLMPASISPKIIQSLGGVTPNELYEGREDYLAIVDNQKMVESMEPDFAEMAQQHTRGFIVSAVGDEVDFVSRCFFPRFGINEDPVTGSAHTTLAPYWAGQLGKLELSAQQLSARRGHLRCRHLGIRTEISGQAVTFMTGSFEL